MERLLRPVVGGTKQCGVCLEWKTVAEFYRRAGSEHPRSKCKKCSERYKRDLRRKKAAVRKPQVVPGHKICSGCKQELLLSCFDKVPSRNNQVLAKCKICSYAVQKEWRETEAGRRWTKDSGKRQRASLAYQTWRTAPGAKERERERNRTWHLNNREKYLSRQRANGKQKREKYKESYDKWRARYLQTEAGKASSSRAVHKRRQLIESQGALLTAQEWADIKDSQGGLCAYCGERKKLTMDHVVPLSRMGLHIAANIVGACASCNSSKGNKLLSEWSRDRSSAAHGRAA